MKTYRIVAFLLAIIFVMMAALAVASADTATYEVRTSEGTGVTIRDPANPDRTYGTLKDGTVIEVYRMAVVDGKHRAYFEYEGCEMFVCYDYLIPTDAQVTLQPVREPEKLYSQNGCELYRVKLTIKNFVNVQNAPDTTGGTQKRIFEDDDVWVKSFFTRDGIHWAAIVLPTGQKRYVEAKFLEKVTEETERVEYPLGLYVVIDEKAEMLDRATNRNSKRVRNLHEGYEVTVIEDCGAWVKCQYTNEKGKTVTGYVRGRTLELVEAYDFDTLE